MIAMEYFEERFQDSLVETENAMEYVERFDLLVEA
jgi:hypothetical protein